MTTPEPLDPLPLEHIERPVPPWREGPTLTQCGRPADDVAPPVLSLAEFAAKLTRLGQARTSMTTCVTCWQTASRHGNVSWEGDPVAVIAREVAWARSWRGEVRDSDAARLFRDELVAFAELAARHAEEFAAIITGLQSAPRLADARRKRNATRRRA